MIEDFCPIREVPSLEGYQPEIGRVLRMLEAARWRLLESLQGLGTAVIPAQRTYKSIAFQSVDWLYRYSKEK